MRNVKIDAMLSGQMYVYHYLCICLYVSMYEIQNHKNADKIITLLGFN